MVVLFNVDQPSMAVDRYSILTSTTTIQPSYQRGLCMTSTLEPEDSLDDANKDVGIRRVVFRVNDVEHTRR